jgi:hypothetical protein
MIANFDKSRYTGLTKKELFKMLYPNSMRTIRYWINVKYLKDLEYTGYKTRQKHLTPKQVAILDKRLDFWE